MMGDFGFGVILGIIGAVLAITWNPFPPHLALEG